MKTVSATALALALALTALASVPAPAQQGQGPTVTGETGLFTLLDGFTLPRGGWSFGVYYNNWDRLVAPIPGSGPLAPLSDDWDYDWNRLSASVGYGISDRFEVSVMLPWEDISETDGNHVGYVNGHFFEDRIDASGIGNVRLGGKLRLWGSVEEEKALALNAFVELPTGDDDEGVVTGDTGWGLGLNWSPHRSWVARVGYRDPGDADDFDVAEEIEAGVGNAAQVTENLDWITELGATFYQGGDSAPDDNIDLTSGGRLRFGETRNWAFNFALRLELNQLSDTDKYCPIGGLLGVTFFPHPTPPPPPPPPPPQEIQEVCLFDSGSARVDNRCRAVLDEVALRLKQDPAATARIIGYTDATGSPARNEELAMRRAESARRVLVERHGIDPSRIAVESRAANDPVAQNDTPDGRQQNRRVVITVRLGS